MAHGPQEAHGLHALSSLSQSDFSKAPHADEPAAQSVDDFRFPAAGRKPLGRLGIDTKGLISYKCGVWISVTQ